MKVLFFIFIAAAVAHPVRATDMNGIAAKDVKSLDMDVPTPVMRSASMTKAAGSKAAHKKFSCSGRTCTITTGVNNVCSDGVYTAADLENWAYYQRSIGGNDKWRDPNHQATTATGAIDPLQVPYVVVPREHRELLHTSVRVCVQATGICINAETREIGPRFGELSVNAMMQLGLNAHPAEGQYRGNITYTFHK
jgi:hypothetical protein